MKISLIGASLPLQQAQIMALSRLINSYKTVAIVVLKLKTLSINENKKYLTNRIKISVVVEQAVKVFALSFE